MKRPFSLISGNSTDNILSQDPLSVPHRPTLLPWGGASSADFTRRPFSTGSNRLPISFTISGGNYRTNLVSQKLPKGSCQHESPNCATSNSCATTAQCQSSQSNCSSPAACASPITSELQLEPESSSCCSATSPPASMIASKCYLYPQHSVRKKRRLNLSARNFPCAQEVDTTEDDGTLDLGADRYNINHEDSFESGPMEEQTSSTGSTAVTQTQSTSAPFNFSITQNPGSFGTPKASTNAPAAISFPFDDFVDNGVELDFTTPNASSSRAAMSVMFRQTDAEDDSIPNGDTEQGTTAPEAADSHDDFCLSSEETTSEQHHLEDINSEQEHSSCEDEDDSHDDFCTGTSSTEAASPEEESSEKEEPENFFRDLLNAEWKQYQDECFIGSLRPNARLKFQDKDNVLIWRPKKVIRILLKHRSAFKSIKAALYYRKPKCSEWVLSKHTDQFCSPSNIFTCMNPKGKGKGWMEIKHMGKFVPKKMTDLRVNNVFYKCAMQIQFEDEIPLLLNLVFKIDNNKTYQNGISRIQSLTVDSSNNLESTPSGSFGDSFEHNPDKHMSMKRLASDKDFADDADFVPVIDV